MQRSTRRPLVLVAAVVAAVGLVAMPAAMAHNEGIPSVPLAQKNMAHVNNVPNASGNALDFFERKQPDGSVKRYAVAATQGNGFDIVDITEIAHPRTVGRYLVPGANDVARAAEYPFGTNWHAWVSVNPRRNIVALTIEDPGGRTTRHNGSVGMQFVDITDVTAPKPLGKVDGLEGPHTVRMIGDNHAYTSLPTYIVDYTDPMNPTAKRGIEGHEFWEDANLPGVGYVGEATPTGRWAVLNMTDPANPFKISSTPDLKIKAAHEVYPAPDSSYVGVADFTTGQFDTACPGGGVHFYDISGRYKQGASMVNPVKMGTWFAPFSGAATDPSSTNPNYGSCTMHSWQHHPERSLALAGLYTGGTWVFDPSSATQSGGTYVEFDGGSRGKTTWGNTVGNFRDATDFVNAAQWLPFDMPTEADERYIVTNGWERGLDVYRYTGPLPKKQSRVRITSAAGGTVAGVLERYAVLTSTGWKNLPLADQTVTVSANGASVTAATGPQGAFSAALPLVPGANTITVTWEGDARFAAKTTTTTVQVS